MLSRYIHTFIMKIQLTICVLTDQVLALQSVERQSLSTNVKPLHYDLKLEPLFTISIQWRS